MLHIDRRERFVFDSFKNALNSGFEEKAIGILKNNERYLSKRCLRKVCVLGADRDRVVKYILTRSVYADSFCEISEIPSQLISDLSNKAVAGFLNVEIANGAIRLLSDQSVAIHHATKIDDAKTIEWLIENGADLSSDANQMIRYASERGRGEIVKVLLKHDSVDPMACDGVAIINAAKFGHLKIVKMLLPYVPPDSTYISDCLLRASYRGHDKIVQLLLEQKECDPSHKDNYSVQVAAQNYHEKTLKMLLAHKYVDPSADFNHCIQHSCSNFGLSRGYSPTNRTKVVKILLTCDQVDPRVNECMPIKSAAELGLCQVVEILLDNRTFIWQDGNHVAHKAFRAACGAAQYDVVELLLNRETHAPDVSCLSLVKERWNPEKRLWESNIRDLILRKYATNQRIRPEVLLSHAKESEKNELRIMMLERDDYDPSVNNNAALRDALKCGNNRIVALLLDHPKVRQSIGLKC